MRAVVPNTDYFKPIFFKFKIFVNNSNSKIICNFCICGEILSTAFKTVSPRVLSNRSNTLRGGEEIFSIDIFRKNTSKYVKLMVELCVCDDSK